MENEKFEDVLKKLEETVKQLESGETDLEVSINKYTEAMKLVKICDDKLKAATEAVNKVLSENGTFEDFEVEK
ncbi:MAG TPA: exodeoxyribonuclease VII small subunit [Mollicutes bacterium]|nr:exodeoxyribonuclease VII small subunit [Mollicutes bacterium]